jgi:hypothetical protein
MDKEEIVKEVEKEEVTLSRGRTTKVPKKYT